MATKFEQLAERLRADLPRDSESNELPRSELAPCDSFSSFTPKWRICHLRSLKFQRIYVISAFCPDPKNTASLALGLLGRKRPEDVLSIQDALYKAVERDYSLTGEQVKQILQRRSLPSGDSFEAYGFCLIKNGWSGKQRLWQVEKIKVES